MDYYFQTLIQDTYMYDRNSIKKGVNANNFKKHCYFAKKIIEKYHVKENDVFKISLQCCSFFITYFFDF